MGAVYRAVEEATGRHVAVKVILGEAPSPVRLERFEREGRLTASLDHPGIVRVHSAGSTGGVPYLVYELVEGARDLHAALRAAPLPQRLAWLRDAAEAVGHAHERGVVHRDLKPENLLLDHGGRIRVSDFGLAYHADQERVTASLVALGTPLYMPPEQLTGQRDQLGPTADVWSLGVVLYEALTSELPFPAESLAELHGMLSTAAPRPPRELVPELDPRLEAIVLCCLKRDPAARYPNGAALAADLTRHLAGESVQAHRRRLLRRAAAWIGMGALAALLTWAATAPARPALDPGDPEAPWPAAEPGWNLAWWLGEGSPEVDAAALWTEPGSVAAPLHAVASGDARALAAAYPWGEARLDQGLVEVRYTRLREALLPEARLPGDALAHFPARLLRPGGDGPAVEVHAPNDSGAIDFQVGHARWARPRIACTAQPLGPNDMRRLHLWLGSGSDRLKLNVLGRSQRVGSEGSQAPFRLAPTGSRLAFAPGAPVGERLVFDGRWSEEIEAKLALPVERGPAGFQVAEHHVRLSDLSVGGRPLRPDAPALAWVPGHFGASVRIRAEFSQPDHDLDGGPLLVLGTDREGLALEVRRDLLLLRRGRTPLARLPLGEVPTHGWLELAREGDLARGRLVVDGEERTVARFDPRPLAYPRAGYGSSASRVTFARVEVRLGPARGPREAYDRGRPQAPSFAARWRSAAWRLVRLTTLAHADPARVGRAGRDARFAEARDLAATLDAVAEDPRAPPALRDDALARAALAAVVCAEGEWAEALAQRLVAIRGPAGAASCLDVLTWHEDLPSTLKQLKHGWQGRASDPTVQDAALRLHDALVPTDPLVPLLRAKAAVQWARGERSPSARREALRAGLALCDEARARGADPLSIHGVSAECYLELGRFREAAAGWRALADARASWYVCSRLALCLLNLGDPEGALLASLQGLSFTPGAPKGSLLRLLQTAAARCAERSPGHAAVACLVLRDAGVQLANPDLHRALAQRALDGQGRGRSVDFDLGLYVEAQAGREDVIVPLGGRPTSALALARWHLRGGRTEDARQVLEEAVAASPLVGHVALLDPQLRALVPSEGR
jgi:hypothetical protein